MGLTYTRDDVARHAGVSSATVSRAYNAPGKVASDKLVRVRRAAAALGYTPDRHASALRRNGTSTILLLLPEQGHTTEQDTRIFSWLVADAILSVRDALEPTLFGLQIGSLTEAGAKDFTAFLDSHPCDGLIAGERLDRELLARELPSCPVPYVACQQCDTLPGLNLCYIDEAAGGAVAAQALQAEGCRRPAHIAGDRAGNHTSQARWEGFRDAFGGRNVVLVDGDIGIAGGYASGMRLAPQVRRGAVDGVFVVNDLTAVGVLQAFQAAGVRVPDDVAIVGYDNLPLIHTLPVPLATVDVGMGRLYRRAAECLLALLQAPGACIHEAVVPCLVPGATLWRGSAAPTRAGVPRDVS